MYNAPSGYPSGPPSAYQPYTPPPPKKSNALLMGLGGCGLFIVILGIMGGLAVNRVMKSSGFRKTIQQAQASQECGQNLFTVRTALNSYRKAHGGNYPAALSDLSPNYLPDSSALVCGNEADQDVMKAEYAPPKPNAPADAAVISYNSKPASFISFNTRRNGNQNAKVSTIHSVRLLKDGRIVTDQITRTEMGGTSDSGAGSSSDSGAKSDGGVITGSSE